jgi:DNA-binding beta-propeller fold protein YncE
MRGRGAGLATLIAGVVLGATARAEPGARAFILDSGANAVVAVDLASATRLGEVLLQGTPSWIQPSPDGRHLVALDRGPGKDKKERGFEASGRSSATVIDATTLKVIGRVELGYGRVPGSSLFFPEGQMVALCEGYDAKNAKDVLPRELVTFDLANARETGRLTLEFGTHILGQSDDERTLALIQGWPRKKKFPFPQSRVWLVDLTVPSIITTLEAGSWRGAHVDGERVYLIDPGKADKKPKKNRNAAIDVIPFSEPRVERLDAGWEVVAGMWLEQLLLVASDGTPGGSSGEVRAFRGGVPVATLAVAESPRLVEQVEETIYVVGSKAVTLIDATTLEVTGTIPLARGGKEVVDDDHLPFELAVTGDGRRAVIHYPAQDKVAVLDLEGRQALGSIKTGRGKKKFFGALLSGLTYGATDRIYHYGAGDPPQMQVRPDGRFAYVLNRDTNDVTVVDVEAVTSVEKIGGGGYEVRLFGEQTVVVVGDEIHIIDATRNEKAREISLSGLRGMLTTEDGAFAVALAEQTAVILDGSTGQERGRLTGFVRATKVVFPPSPQAATP